MGKKLLRAIMTMVIGALMVSNHVSHAQDKNRVTVLDDFATTELTAGKEGEQPIGFLTWSDGSGVSIEKIKVEPGTELALPGQTASTSVLKLNTDIKAGGWGGFTHAFTNEARDKWVAQDWSSYEGVSILIYTTGTGGTHFIDVLESRNANSKKDDAERWSFGFPDDAKGWKTVRIPFKDLRRKDIGNGAPNDGLALTEVYGYAIGNSGSKEMGKHSDYVASVSLYGYVSEDERPVEVSFLKETGSAVKGGRATFTIKLNKKAKVPVTVELVAGEGTAIVDKHFTIPVATVTFEPGSIEEKIRVEVADDGRYSGQRRAVLALANPQGAQLGGVRRSILTIRETYPADPNLLLDFDEVPPFRTAPGVTLALAPATGDLALPPPAVNESVLKISYDKSEAGTAGTLYAAPRDWTGKTGLSFMAYGNNTGKTYSVELLTGKTTPTAAPSDWKLAWSDEFDDPAGTFPNAAVWKPELGDGLLNGIPGWGNSELEYYTDSTDNAATDGKGNLVITVRKVDPANSPLVCWYGACEYTSARLITANKLEVAYGRVEARVKLPTGQGLWPAFWMLGTDIGEVGWPQSGEIDIMEYIGSQTAQAFGTIHGPGYSGGQSYGKKFNLKSGTFADDFHTFAVEWQPDEIRWLIDGETYFTATPKDLPAGAQWVFNHPFFIILNVAVGGNLPGPVGKDTVFPASMTVDYVRVYQAQSSYRQFAASFKDDFTGWKQITLPFSTFRASENGAALNLADVWGYGLRFPAGETGTLYLDKVRFAP
jgi:beta-glucanase (GH16 family)